MSAFLALVLDGARIPADRAAILPTERGLLYGDGLFETMPVLRGKALGTLAHLARLVASAEALAFPAPDPDRIAADIAACLAAAGPDAAVVRVTWMRGSGPGTRGYAPPDDTEPHRLVAAYSAPIDIAARLADGVSAVAVGGLVPGDVARHKTLSALGYVTAAALARAAGAREAVLVSHDDSVLETAGANVFAVVNGFALTPPATLPILAGIGRARALATLGENASETPLPLAELASADEAFLTNAVWGAIPLVSLDGRPIGDGTPGPVTRRVADAHRAWCAAQSGS